MTTFLWIAVFVLLSYSVSATIVIVGCRSVIHGYLEDMQKLNHDFEQLREKYKVYVAFLSERVSTL